jgi:sialate O-acetylesterase
MLKLASILKDGMVLQRDSPVKIYGWADPAVRVHVSLAGNNRDAIAGIDGKWLALLPPLGAGGPYEMEVWACGSRIVVKDILMGDLWLLTGQSNMQVPLIFSRGEYEEEKPFINFQEIRHFTVPMQMNFEKPMEDIASKNMGPPGLPEEDPDAVEGPPSLPAGRWFAAVPDAAPFFSAVGYHFARALYEAYRVPIGLISACIGGTPVEAWMSRESLAGYPAELAEADKFADEKVIRETVEGDAARLIEWNKALDAKDPGLAENWQLSEYDDSSWEAISLNDDWAAHPDMPSCGSVWFRATVDAGKEIAGKPCRLCLGMLVEGDRCYVNGVLVGSGDTRWFNRNYPIPGGLKPGRNVIALRVLSQRRLGRVVPGCTPETSQRLVGENFSLSLENLNWKYRPGAACGPLEEGTTIFYKPTGLYHGMIAPLHNFVIKGALWYQGESHTEEPTAYADQFCGMITGWRRRWGIGDFPVFFVQLPNFAPLEPGARNWAYLREEQRRCLRLPRTAMITAIDTGETWDIHPPHKRIIGQRMALAARHVAYGENLVFSGPVLADCCIDGNHALLRFYSLGDGLASRDGGPLRGFAVFDGKKIWPAEAKIEGSAVVVHCPPAAEIRAVQYAWESNPLEANLINKNGLPAPPFDTRFSLPALF